MKLLLAFLFFVAFVSASAAILPKSNELVGTWKLIRVVTCGIPAEANRSVVTRTFDGHSFIVRKDGKVILHARYSIEPNANPRKIDTEYMDGPVAGRIFHGIYEISADGLKICTMLDGGAAPARFESPKGSKIALDFYERM